MTLFVYNLHDFQKSDERRLEGVNNKLKNYLNIFNEPLYSDVVFIFPYAGEESMQLFSSVALLTGTSDYFRDMFMSSGFAESLSTNTNANSSAEQSATPKVDSDDSDIERDEALRSHYVPKPLVREASTFKFITIEHTCYSTYRAALYYLFSNEIRFAPLKSHETARKIQEAVSVSGEAQPLPPKEPEHLNTNPLMVSPKSLFKLAHVYGIDGLKHLAMENILSQLTPHNALLELHSRFSDTYDEVRQVYMKYLAKNWGDVSRSPVASHIMEEHGSLSYSLVKELMSTKSSSERERSGSRVLPLKSAVILNSQIPARVFGEMTALDLEEMLGESEDDIYY
ncbi:hypothetical protein BT69DRAFT_1338412 [Atractiella rhizophila]|nr:hypothetical protein BT69DRAFT_1338412 [Atractiella rhizophila]